jgi:hypothetical protein
VNPPRRRHLSSERSGTLSAGLTPERRAQIKALVGCPKCKAEPEHGCKAPNSGAYTKLHTDRVFAAMRDPRFTW